jgi:hypothetical protein
MKKAIQSSPVVHGEQILETVFRLLSASGVDSMTLGKTAANALDRVSRSQDHSEATYARMLALASVLHRWNNRRPYIDRHANPLPIKLRGKAPSLESLRRSERIQISVETMAREMSNLGVIRKHRSRYLPTGRQMIGRPINPIVAQYAATTIARLLSTIENNIRAGRRLTLIERFAFVPDLSSQEYVKFCDFSHAQGTELVNAINDWLETRRIGSGNAHSAKTTPVGVHIFAFKQPNARAGHLS